MSFAQRCFEALEKNLERSEIMSAHPALMVDLVLRKIFGFLELKDLMICRSVCEKWKCVAESKFKKSVRICFDFEEDCNELAFSKYPAPADLNDFFRFSQDEYLFSALRLSNHISWSTRSLTKFFLNEGQFITDLILTDVILKETNKSDTFLQTYNLKKLVGGIESLKSLKINYKNPDEDFSATTTKFSVCVEQLKNISSIHLEYCTIELQKDIFITPCELHLMSNNFKRSNDRVENCVLNEFVDFCNLKKLSVDCKVDMSGNVQLDSLLLFNVDLLNFEKSCWNVQSLEFYAVPFVTETKMKFKEFSISAAECDLRCLPQSVNELMIGADCRIIQTMPWSINLPNIKTLTLESDEVAKFILPFIPRCFTNLGELSFRSHVGSVVNIDLNMIPNGVKVLNLLGNDFEFSGVGVVVLDILNLVFTDYLDLAFVLETTNHFSLEQLKVFIRFPSHNTDLQYLTAVLNNVAIPKITVGPVIIQDTVDGSEAVFDTIEITKERFVWKKSK